jgi:hypothetical protein
MISAVKIDNQLNSPNNLLGRNSGDIILVQDFNAHRIDVES